MVGCARRARHRAAIGALVLAIAAGAMPTAGPVNAPDTSIEAAFLYNFAKFVEWPMLPSAAPIVVCIVGNDAVAAALVEIVRGQNIRGHALEMSQPQDSGTWRDCRVLFFADREVRQFGSAKSGILASPVLTVSDAKGFSQTGGIIELFVENDRMRFFVNLDAAEQAGLRLSSRLLGLAKIVRNAPVQ